MTRCLVLSLVVLAAGCRAGEPLDPTPAGLSRVASIALSTDQDTMFVTDAVTLTIETRDSAGNLLSGRAVRWQSSVPSIASVSPQGVVTGVSPGNATITAAAGDQHAQVDLVIRRLIFSVNVVPDAVCLRKGFQTVLTLTAFDSLGAPLPRGLRPIAWRSSDGLIATVTPQPGDSAFVLGASPGLAFVIGAIMGVADTTSFIVDPAQLGEPLQCGNGGG